jgi:hypothetical protein
MDHRPLSVLIDPVIIVAEDLSVGNVRYSLLAVS